MKKKEKFSKCFSQNFKKCLHEDMHGIDPKIAQHNINIHAHMVLVKQKMRRLRTE